MFDIMTMAEENVVEHFWPYFASIPFVMILAIITTLKITKYTWPEKIAETGLFVIITLLSCTAINYAIDVAARLAGNV